MKASVPNYNCVAESIDFAFFYIQPYGTNEFADEIPDPSIRLAPIAGANTVFGSRNSGKVD
jgi:hypothetical protein